MPPTNYIWMRTNMKDELIGVYEWLNEKWHKIEIDYEDKDVYTKTEVDILLQITEQEQSDFSNIFDTNTIYINN